MEKRLFDYSFDICFSSLIVFVFSIYGRIFTSGKIGENIGVTFPSGNNFVGKSCVNRSCNQVNKGTPSSDTTIDTCVYFNLTGSII